MNIDFQFKPAVTATLCEQTNQLNHSLNVLNDEPLSQNARFHLNQVLQVLCTGPDPVPVVDP